LPRALRAKDQLEKVSDADVTLIKGKGGVFEFTVDGKLLFSKKQLGRYPTDEEIVALVAGG
jgi:selenoprotein W-related protein